MRKNPEGPKRHSLSQYKLLAWNRQEQGRRASRRGSWAQGAVIASQAPSAASLKKHWPFSLSLSVTSGGSFHNERREENDAVYSKAFSSCLMRGKFFSTIVWKPQTWLLNQKGKPCHFMSAFGSGLLSWVLKGTMAWWWRDVCGYSGHTFLFVLLPPLLTDSELYNKMPHAGCLLSNIFLKGVKFWWTKALADSLNSESIPGRRWCL